MKRGELDDLLAFATIARERNFRRAAAKLDVSPSALSRKMLVLEQRLGLRLLARTTRSVVPTPAGERLLSSVEHALNQVKGGIRALGQWCGEPSGPIKITTAQFGARTLLAPMLPKFLAEYPKVSIEVSVDSRLIDLVRDGFDAGIRWGENIDQDMVAVRIGPNTRMIVVASPVYFEARTRPLVPSDLKHHSCINYRNKTAGGLFLWRLQSDVEEVRVRTEGQVIVDEPKLAIDLVLAGAGLGLVLEPHASAHLKAGRLVKVLDDWSLPFGGPHLYYPSRHVSPGLRALVGALRWNPQNGQATRDSSA